MSETQAGGSIPKIGDLAPEFEAVTTQGPLKLSDLRGQWVVLFSHPADFTPVCTTEFVAFTQKYDEFQKRQAKLIGLSVDSIHSHLAWKRNIEEKLNVKVPFPVIADLDMKVAEKFGMIHPGEGPTATVRAVFLIDPQGVVRALVYYPMTTGRNVDEIIRLLDALQTTDANQVGTPANWCPGDQVIVLPPKTEAEVAQREETAKASGYDKVDFYLVKKSL